MSLTNKNYHINCKNFNPESANKADSKFKKIVLSKGYHSEFKE